jgi:hypothetical protein
MRLKKGGRALPAGGDASWMRATTGATPGGASDLGGFAGNSREGGRLDLL